MTGSISSNTPSITRTEGPTFNPDAPPTYFLAGDVGTITQALDQHDDWLIAVNEIDSLDNLATVWAWGKRGKRVFIDSGIYHLTMEHVRATGITMDQALNLPPEEIQGFDTLFDRYCQTYDALRDVAWGFIELDQGGRENKIRIRARLEGMGYRPIPVYHPLSDGWDYFDYLAERYDRICFGNVVQADRDTRLRLVATAWERKQKYPHLWIHLLGLTPNEHLYAMPINSGDSSSWSQNVRWGRNDVSAMGQTIGALGDAYNYQRGNDDEARSSRKAIKRAAQEAHYLARNWQTHHALNTPNLTRSLIQEAITP